MNSEIQNTKWKFIGDVCGASRPVTTLRNVFLSNESIKKCIPECMRSSLTQQHNSPKPIPLPQYGTHTRMAFRHEARILFSLFKNSTGASVAIISTSSIFFAARAGFRLTLLSFRTRAKRGIARAGQILRLGECHLTAATRIVLESPENAE
jgi:hypothetical protein